MGTEIAMIKRPAMAKGEIGLFTDDPIASEDLAHVPSAQGLLVKAWTPRRLPQHRYAWALARKVSDNCDWLIDQRAAMDWLLIRSRHVRYIHNPNTDELTILPQSISFAAMPQDAFNRLLNRIVYVVCSEIIPGLEESDLRRELEAMCVGDKHDNQRMAKAS